MNRGEMDHFDVFLSHAAPDLALAQVVQQRLGDAKIVCRPSRSDAPASEYTDEHIQTVLDASRAYVAIASRSSIQAPALFVEVGAASASKLPILFLLNDLASTDLPVFFKQFPSFSLWKGFPRLIKALEKLPERVLA